MLRSAPRKQRKSKPRIPPEKFSFELTVEFNKTALNFSRVVDDSHTIYEDIEVRKESFRLGII